MQQVLLVDVDTGIPVLQDEDDSGLGQLRSGYHGIHAKRGMLYVGVLLDVAEQVDAELVEPQVHDVDTTLHVLHVNHLFL